MNEKYMLLLMIFLHIVDDYYLQGWLASAKQKSWWKEHAPDEMYKNDYIMALFTHGFSWSFMIMIPVFIKSIGMSEIYQYLAYMTLVVNMCVHAIIDDEKANQKTINLC